MSSSYVQDNDDGWVYKVFSFDLHSICACNEKRLTNKVGLPFSINLDLTAFLARAQMCRLYIANPLNHKSQMVVVILMSFVQDICVFHTKLGVIGKWLCARSWRSKLTVSDDDIDLRYEVDGVNRMLSCGYACLARSDRARRKSKVCFE